MSRLYQRGLTTSLGGNISTRISDDQILITPSNVDKQSLSDDDMVTLDLNGNVISGNYKPSMEYMMHVQIYNERPEVTAIIHAHPFYSTLLSASDVPINTKLTAEACKNLKHVEVVDYQLMGTRELADKTSKAALKSNVILLQNHGVVTVGVSMLEAFYRMEILEQAAKMTTFAAVVNLRELSNEAVNILISL